MCLQLTNGFLNTLNLLHISTISTTISVNKEVDLLLVGRPLRNKNQIHLNIPPPLRKLKGRNINVVLDNVCRKKSDKGGTSLIIGLINQHWLRA